MSGENGLGVWSRHVVDWIELEGFWFFFPALNDVLEGCEPSERLEPFSVIVGVDEGLEMLTELIVATVVIPSDSWRVTETESSF